MPEPLIHMSLTIAYRARPFDVRHGGVTGAQLAELTAFIDELVGGASFAAPETLAAFVLVYGRDQQIRGGSIQDGRALDVLALLAEFEQVTSAAAQARRAEQAERERDKALATIGAASAAADSHRRHTHPATLGDACDACWMADELDQAAASDQAEDDGGGAVKSEALDEIEAVGDDAPVYPDPGAEIPGQPGYVVGACGHRVAGSEWRAGFRTCERCPDETQDGDDCG